jgi:hypothetical protein
VLISVTPAATEQLKNTECLPVLGEANVFVASSQTEGERDGVE